VGSVTVRVPPPAYRENNELRGSDRLESHVIPKSLNPSCALVDKLISPMCVKVMGPQLTRGIVAGEHIEGTGYERVGHAARRPSQRALSRPPHSAMMARADPRDGRGHYGELDVSPLQHALDPIGLPTGFLDQPGGVGW
jgi:hypothetical protein